ncbi:STAS-like domain-containing protein [Patescibacteria group bacterium]|nr:STAS-like domain-containing protein [Patescibacteria group bacterium]MBU1885900.1 STAS-like domain-containing protein [Patescibacteria group bacterium]
MNKNIKMRKIAGDFAENKDIAKKLRIEEIIPSLLKGDEVILDFAGISGATQSFIHALISDPIRELRGVAFDHLIYKNANDDIREIVSIVYRYMQESLDRNDEN